MRRSTFSPLIGTTVKLSVDCAPWHSEIRSTARIVAEIRRLSDVFNIFQASSEISKLAATGTTDSSELLELLELAEVWTVKSGGRFNPNVGAPAPNLNAIAKGWMIDRASMCSGRIRALVVDAGGDVLHRGSGSISVGIENPHRPYDNEPPLSAVAITNAAIATSGPSRRGDHLIDPRTGNTPTELASASVVASDAATADVVATILAVGNIEEGLVFARQLGLAVALVDAAGELHRTDQWRSIEVQPK